MKIIGEPMTPEETEQFEADHADLLDALSALIGPLGNPAQVTYCHFCDGVRLITHTCACSYCGKPPASCGCPWNTPPGPAS